jgi:hypothetical protein
MAENGLVEELAESPAVVPSGQEGDEPRRGGLRGEALVRRFASWPVPDGGPEGGVVGEPVGVVLAGQSQGGGRRVFAGELGHGIADEALVALVMESVGKRRGQTKIVRIPKSGLLKEIKQTAV